MAKILIAEDDKFLSTAFQIKLTKLGYEVKIAGDGNEVLEILKTLVVLFDFVHHGVVYTMYEIRRFEKSSQNVL